MGALVYSTEARKAQKIIGDTVMLLLLLQLAKFASGEEQGKTPGDGFSRDNVIGVLSVASQIGDFFRTSALTAQFFFYSTPVVCRSC